MYTFYIYIIYIYIPIGYYHCNNTFKVYVITTYYNILQTI